MWFRTDNAWSVTYVAFGLEGREASGMLRVLVSPEHPVGVVLVDPELLHVCKKIFLAVRSKPVGNGLSGISRHRRAIRLAVSGVGRRLRVVLAAQVAVLGVGSYERG